MTPVLLLTGYAVYVIMTLHESVDLTVRAIMNVLWPVVVMCLLEPTDRCNCILLAPMTWMAMVWWLDSYSLLHGTKHTGGVRLDSHSITAMSFGLCGLVGARSDTRYTHLVLYALLLCIMFVLPVHNLPDTDPLATLVGEVQHMCLIWSISMVITGVILTRQICKTV